MYPSSHFFAGFLVLSAFAQLTSLEITSAYIAVAVIASLLPDLDGFIVDDMSKHHDGVLHAPLFWIFVSTAVYLLGYKLTGVIGGVSVLFHLFTDFVTARTVGIEVFHPFSSKKYSLFEVDPSIGNFNPSRPSKEDLEMHLSYYMANKPALIFEIGINLAGAAAFIQLLI